MPPRLLAFLVATILLGCRPAAPARPLAIAAAGGQTATLQRLLAAGVDADEVDTATGLTPLALAARADHPDAIRALVDGGADPNRPSGRNGWTPLLHAIHKGRVASVRTLVATGANVNRAVGWGFTPLMMAVGNGNESLVDFLLDVGADPAAALGDGTTVLAFAVSGGALTDIERPLLGRCHPRIVEALLSRDPSLRLGASHRTRLARWLAGFNGCDAALRLAERR